MGTKRAIIQINEELCNGCGECITTCAESALKLVNGKAKLVSDIYCDGLGACLQGCPTGALTIIEREAPAFDEKAVEELLKSQGKSLPHAPAKAPEPALPCGCPGSSVRVVEPTKKPAGADAGEIASELRQWPIKLGLLGPQAPFLQGADVMLLADCGAVSHPDLHRKILRGHRVLIGCPKLDNLEAHLTRLTEILKGAKPKSLTVVHMEVPCCYGFVRAAEEAMARAGIDIPLKRIEVGIGGEILSREDLSKPQQAADCGCCG